MSGFGHALRGHRLLEESMDFLNHGWFGAAPHEAPAYNQLDDDRRLANIIPALAAELE